MIVSTIKLIPQRGPCQATHVPHCDNNHSNDSHRLIAIIVGTVGGFLLASAATGRVTDVTFNCLIFSFVNLQLGSWFFGGNGKRPKTLCRSWCLRMELCRIPTIVSSSWTWPKSSVLRKSSTECKTVFLIHKHS